MAPVGEAYENPAFHLQGTGGSTSVRVHAAAARQAGAAAREMLKLAAAERWACRSRSATPRAAGVHGPKGRSRGTASWPRRPRSPPAEPPLKRPVGTPDRPAGAPPRSSGEGPRQRCSASTCACRTWCTRRSASHRYSAARSRASQTGRRSRPGVLAVVPLDDAVAVGRRTSGRRRRQPTPSRSPGTRRRRRVDDAAIMALFRSKIDGEAAIGSERGDVDGALAGAVVVEAECAAVPRAQPRWSR